MKVKTDRLKQFVNLRQALEAEKISLETRLAEINQALGSSPAVAAPAAPKAESKRGRKPGRAKAKAAKTRNAAPLKDLILQIVSETPLNRRDLLNALEKRGYRFNTDKPLNSLSAMLYSKKGKDVFKIKDGIVRPA